MPSDGDIVNWATVLGGARGGLVGGFLGNTIAGNLLGGDKKKAKRQAAQSRLGQHMAAYADTEGWGDDMAGLFDRFLAAEKGQRFIDNASEFYSRPGAYQTMQDLQGLRSMQMPTYASNPAWQAALKQSMLGPVQAQYGQARQAANQASSARGYMGAQGASQRNQVAQQQAMAEAAAQRNYQLSLAQALQDEFAKKYGYQSQTFSLANSLLQGTPAYPIIQKADEPAGWEKAIAAIGTLGQGVGGMASVFGAL